MSGTEIFGRRTLDMYKCSKCGEHDYPVCVKCLDERLQSKKEGSPTIISQALNLSEKVTPSPWECNSEFVDASRVLIPILASRFDRALKWLEKFGASPAILMELEQPLEDL